MTKSIANRLVESGNADLAHELKRVVAAYPSDKLLAQERTKINNALFKHFRNDKNLYAKKPGMAVTQIAVLLERFNIVIDDVISLREHKGETVTRRFHIAWSNPDNTKDNVIEIRNSLLIFSYYFKEESTRYGKGNGAWEIGAYLS